MLGKKKGEVFNQETARQQQTSVHVHAHGALSLTHTHIHTLETLQGSSTCYAAIVSPLIASQTCTSGYQRANGANAEWKSAQVPFSKRFSVISAMFALTKQPIFARRK